VQESDFEYYEIMRMIYLLQIVGCEFEVITEETRVFEIMHENSQIMIIEYKI
jgi:hypothetical protein